jgi:hypothetical protein
MSGLPTLARWLWGISTAAQTVLFVALLIGRNFRKIPIFTAYVAANLCQAVLIFMVYKGIGFRPQSAIPLAWSSQACIHLLRAAATTEALRKILKTFQGIWGLAWRTLAVAFGVIFLVAVFDSGRNISWAVLLVDRGFHLAFAIALVACLLLVHYYSVLIPSAYKALLGGFCFFSCAVVLANTLGGVLFLRQVANFQMIWQLVTMCPFIAVLLVWAVALRKPLPDPIQSVELQGPKTLYWEVSPQINERLRLLNEQLNRLWKPEASRH